MLHIQEAPRSTPVVGEYDVIVAGGGPAGVCAALAAARAGASVALVELHGCLGGIWTTGLLSWLVDHDNKPGIMREITDALQARGAVSLKHCYDAEQMKLVLEQLCLQANISIRLHTRLVAAVRDGGRLQAVVTESKSGREAWAARCFVDCTGDGDLAALAGCRYDFGHPETGRTQPMTLMALIGGIEFEPLNAAGVVRGNTVSNWKAKVGLREMMHRLGITPSYGDPTLFPVAPSLMALMMNHEYGVSALSADDLTKATLQARGEIHAAIEKLRSTGGVWSDVRVIATAAQIGVREGRRIRGRYQVTTEDIRKGARFDDAVCRVTAPVDVHSTDPQQTTSCEQTHGFNALPYDIPLRALIAADVDNLMMAGRCISGDFLAHSSYRVTGNAAAMGEAAGTVAARAAMSRLLLQDVAWPQTVAATSTGTQG